MVLLTMVSKQEGHRVGVSRKAMSFCYPHWRPMIQETLQSPIEFHNRPAALIARTLKRVRIRITVTRAEQTEDGKSVYGWLIPAYHARQRVYYHF